MSIRAISIIIPARNEEEYLPRCLESISRAGARIDIPIEIVVVINRCTDNTESVAQAAGCVIAHDDSKNLARIRNTGCSKASGELLITVDADSYIPKSMLAKILKVLEDPRVVGGGTSIVPDRWSLGIALTFFCLVPLALYYGVSGGLFFCRKEDFLAIGGFNESLASVEDIDFARRLKAYARSSKRKFRNLYTSYIITSTRKFDRLGDWYFLRNPRLIARLLRGNDQKSANKIWYDFDR